LAAFQPLAGQTIVVAGTTYTLAEHPITPGMPDSYEGKQSTVYRLTSNLEEWALKVFRPRFRVPYLLPLSAALAPFASLLGLRVCNRTILNPRQHAELLRQNLDLTYAAIMPWVNGPTWAWVMLQKRSLTHEQSLALAHALLEVLTGLENKHVAHCDLSSDNVILPAFANVGLNTSVGAAAGHPANVEFVDVERLYAPGLERPDSLQSGSPGYSHETATSGLWEARADRFAGAVLLAEMLGWCDQRVRDTAWGESYFEPGEMQKDTSRHKLLANVIQQHWGDGPASLFERAWNSNSLQDCPTFGDWLAALPLVIVPASSISDYPASAASATASVTTQAPAIAMDINAVDEGPARALADMAAQLQRSGNLPASLEIYRQAQGRLPAGSLLAQELAVTIRGLESWLSSQAAYTPPNSYPQPAPIPSNPPVQPQKQRRPGAFALAIVPILLILALGGFWGVAAWRDQQETEQANAQATTTAQAQVQATEIAQALALNVTSTAIAIEKLHADETATSVTEGATATAQMVAVIGEVQATTTAQAHETIIASDRSTAVAQVWATSTEQTRQTATARADLATIEALRNIPTSTPYTAQSGGPTGQIAFASNRDDPDQSHIYLINADGSGERRLTSGSDYDLYPDWSPDGRTLVYHHGPNPGCATDVPAGDIFTIDIYTLQTQQLTFGRCASGHRWSPDGSYIVYTDSPDNKLTSYDIHLMRSDGRYVRRLTNTTGFDGNPSWTPDGRIIFVSERDHLNDDDNEIYIMNTDGSNLRRITYMLGEKRNPAVSASSQLVAFAWWREESWNIYTMTLNGDSIYQVTSPPGRNLFPTWSPDGRWLAYHSNPLNKEDYDIFTISAYGGSRSFLTTNPAYDTGPSWSR
jgi:tol-pal system beta propeller repeat protein TolB